jgi:8-oxo-dGTP diphosphatase
MSRAQDSNEQLNPQASVVVRVLAAVVQEDGRYLICKRPASKRHGGLWEFPGGKLEPGETWLHAAKRELREELGVETTEVGEPLLAVHDDGSPFEINFVPVKIVGDPRALEHDEIQWLEPMNLMSLPLAPSDLRFTEWLIRTEHE